MCCPCRSDTFPLARPFLPPRFWQAYNKPLRANNTGIISPQNLFCVTKKFYKSPALISLPYVCHKVTLAFGKIRRAPCALKIFCTFAVCRNDSACAGRRFHSSPFCRFALFRFPKCQKNLQIIPNNLPARRLCALCAVSGCPVTINRRNLRPLRYLSRFQYICARYPVQRSLKRFLTPYLPP